MAALKNRAPALAGAWGSWDHLAYQLEDLENSNTESSWQSLGEVAAKIVDRIAQRHGLTVPTARLVVDEAGLARGCE